MKKKLKILITGPVPPPAGGISIHIQRLRHLLLDEFEVDLIDESQVNKDGIYNIRSLNIFSYFRKVLKADLLFIHSGNKLFKKIHIITGRLFAKKIIITLHGYGPKRKQPFSIIDSIVFGLAHKIIIVNAGIAGRVSLPVNKYIVKHAFLPPVMKEETALPIAVLTWISDATGNDQTIICANASRLDMHNNQDLYGLDMSIEVAKRLVQKGLPVSFIYTVSSLESGADIFNRNFQLIAALNLQDRFLLINEQLSFVKLIEKSDIVIRPSNADGDALTVREALYLGKMALASDVVERPPGAVIFKTRDMTDLEVKLEMLVQKSRAIKKDNLKTTHTPAEDLKSFYLNLINTVALK